MKLPQLRRRDLLWFVLLCGCSGHDPASQFQGTASIPCEPQVVLANLPVNSDQRCVGIAIVMEALLSTDSLVKDDCLNAPSLADRLYRSAASADMGLLPEFIEHDGERMPLLSQAGLEVLCTLIADRHKQDFARWTANEATSQRLAQAQTSFVQSAEQLRQILRKASDHVAFGGIGVREFPDGEDRETSHAFVLQIQPDGDIVVYDPNDPRSAVPCSLEESDLGVLIQWTCRYRDTESITTQAYHVVPVKDYLDAAFKLPIVAAPSGGE